ncbi:hypothetical protein HP1_051 [Candidatus Termititenax spirochaetophilus]|uniref:Uncharacterized protein n=1 Tax=Candidatus Termititenax spirochaetophilus TaxID=2218522 RepID=A0A388T7L1_9BACT|nr:hypothetical protein HP1_051 [Candidatus Termititenax spirochaetophilus]
MKKILVLLSIVLTGILFTGCNKQAAATDGLWGELAKLKSDNKWVDLSWEVSPETPHWWGFDPLVVTPKYTFDGTFKDFGNNDNNSFAEIYPWLVLIFFI